MLKRICMVAAFVILASGMAFGQELSIDNEQGARHLSEGDVYVHGRLALGAVYGANVGFVAGGEYGLKEGFLNLGDFPASLGVGASLGYSSYTESYLFGEWNYTNILLLGSVYYHADVLDAEEIDTYVVLNLGLNIGSVSWEGSGTRDYGDSYGGIVAGSGLGARYFLSDNLAVTGEVGFGMGLLRLGIDLGI